MNYFGTAAGIPGGNIDTGAPVVHVHVYIHNDMKL